MKESIIKAHLDAMTKITGMRIGIGRKVENVNMRTVLAYVLRQKGLTLTRLGELLNRDHSSVTHMINAMKEAINIPVSNPALLKLYKTYTEYINSINVDNMGKTYIGIDPGSKGFITVIGEEITYKSIADSTRLELSDFLSQFKNQDVACVMEEVHAIFGSSAKGTFNFGEIFGLLQGLLIANEIPYTLIPPKVWQKEMWTHSDEVKLNGKIDTKKTSINVATRLYPREDLKRTPSCKLIDDNKVDSLLIATYAKRKNL